MTRLLPALPPLVTEIFFGVKSTRRQHLTAGVPLRKGRNDKILHDRSRSSPYGRVAASPRALAYDLAASSYDLAVSSCLRSLL